MSERERGPVSLDKLMYHGQIREARHAVVGDVSGGQDALRRRQGCASR